VASSHHVNADGKVGTNYQQETIQDEIKGLEERANKTFTASTAQGFESKMATLEKLGRP